jgi:hypothetical protein
MVTSASAATAVVGKLNPIVKSPTLSKIDRETSPNAPVNNSMAASSGKS